jgi:thymidylate kinase
MIIIEGVDGSGKSTLAQKLAEASPLPVRMEHRGVPEKSIEDEYLAPLLKVGDDELVIADRWHVGETIYGPLYRGNSELLNRPSLNRVIEGVLDDIGTVRVILSPPLRTVKKRLKDRGEDYLLPEHVKLVHGQYEAYANKNEAYTLINKVTDQTVKDLINKAVNR